MPRNTSRLRGIVLAACATATAAALAGCTPPLPPDVQAARAEAQITCQSGDATVAVADGFTGSMTAVGTALTGVCPDQTITERPAGDAAASDQQSSLQLVDAIPSPAAVEAASKACPAGVAVVPAFSYAVAMVFNEPGLEGIVLPPATIAGILNGTITAWDDPAIVAANDGLDLSGLPPISLQTLAAPSGAVAAMTAYLASAAPEAWTQGTVDTLSAGTQAGTVQEVIDALIATEGSMAVLPASLAVVNGLGTNAFVVQDQIVTADDVVATKIGAGATQTAANPDGTQLTVPPAIGGIPVDGTFDLAASKIIVAEGQQLVGWPVMGYAHLIVCTGDPLALSAAQYVVRLAGQGAIEGTGLTPMPEPVRIRTFTPLKVVVNLDESGSPAASSSPAATPAS